MPDMNGIEVARAIRARRPTMAIIFVTGRVGVAALRAEGAPILQKPYSIEMLAEQIAAVLTAER